MCNQATCPIATNVSLIQSIRTQDICIRDIPIQDICTRTFASKMHASKTLTSKSQKHSCVQNIHVQNIRIHDIRIQNNRVHLTIAKSQDHATIHTPVLTASHVPSNHHDVEAEKRGSSAERNTQGRLWYWQT